MFTGIIETTGQVKAIEKDGSNVHFTIASSISNELKIDQSISHNGVCLTVIKTGDGWHVVTAIEETLKRSNLAHLQINSQVNLERAMVANARLDGHMVQGHVDATATCQQVKNVDGSWYFTFKYQPGPDHVLVDKGSVTINGVSLTVVDPVDDLFQVAIIPYTFEHTNFKSIRKGSSVNIEFDIIGKYIAKHIAIYQKSLHLG